MIVRFRGKDGSWRVNAQASTPFSAVIRDLEAQLPPHDGTLAVAAAPGAPGQTATEKWELPVEQLGIKHGDMFYVTYESPESEATHKPGGAGSAAARVEADPVDRQLTITDGRIHRDQTSLCKHGPKGMCEYCQPLEPWDEDYQQSKGIKHTSIHAWRKRIADEGGALEMPNYGVDMNCTNGHSPWPQGFCSKCQPSAITLQQQRFRMVDHVEFANPKIVEQFIEFWRQTNSQRIGFLIGRFSEYDGVPLGIKAEVHAIWEADQDDDVDSLLLKQLPTDAALTAANLLGCRVLGIVFTDLLDVGDGSGKVVTKRHLNSYFLSSLEVLFAARMQNQYPHDLLGERFGSRFVTCVVSGNEFGDIDVACYQASVQAEAMAEADLIVASTNPSVMRIQPPGDHRYVPDIFYKRINEYKLTVQEDAKPSFPVDYLLVSLSHGFKATPVDTTSEFTIENRPQIRSQTPAQLADALGLPEGIQPHKFLDFHLLLYLIELGVLQKDEVDSVSELIKAYRRDNDERVAELAIGLASGPGLNTLRMLAA